MKTIEISKGLKLPLDVVMQPIALLGNRESGKTYGGLKLFELTHSAGVQSIAIDPVGKWWSLRLGRNGKAEGGLRGVYIFGGKRGDFPLLPDKGKVVARVLHEKRISAVLDVSLMRKGDRQRFITDFCEEFYYLAKQADVPPPCVMFLEEAHTVMPQRPQRDDARMLGAIEDIVLLGRNAGMGVVLMDQRPAHVNKSCLAMTEMLIALRTTWKDDRQVYVDWISAKGAINADLDHTLPEFTAGRGYLWVPSKGIFQEIKIPPRETFDASATAKVSGEAVKVGELTKVDKDVLQQSMAEVVEEAESTNPSTLRRRVMELEAQIKRLKEEKAPPAPQVDTAELKESLALFSKGLDQLAHIGDQLAQKQQVVVSTTDTVRMMLGPLLALAARPRPPKPPPGLVVRPGPPKLLERGGGRVKTPEGGMPLIGKSRDMLRLIAAFPRQMDRDRLAVHAIINQTSGTYANYLGALRSGGLITAGAGGIYELTTDGEKMVEQLGGPAEKLTATELAERWKEHLTGKAKEMLMALVQAYPDPVARDRLGAVVEMDPTSGTFANYLGALRTPGLVVKDGGGFKASDALFLWGR